MEANRIFVRKTEFETFFETKFFSLASKLYGVNAAMKTIVFYCIVL